MENPKEKHYDENENNSNLICVYPNTNENNGNTNQIEKINMNKLKKETMKIVNELKDMCSCSNLSDYRIEEKKIEVKNITEKLMTNLDCFLKVIKKLNSLQHISLDFK